MNFCKNDIENINTLKSNATELILGDLHAQSYQYAEPGVLLPSPMNSWYFIFMMVLFSGFIIARLVVGPMFLSAFMATVRFNSTLAMFKDNSQLQKQRDNLLFLFYFLSLSFLLLLLEEYFQILPYGLSTAGLYFWNLILLVALILFRFVVLNLLGLLFDNRKLWKEYLYHSLAFNKIMGIVFLPVNFLLLYTKGILNEVFIYSAVIILILFLILKITRGFIFSIRYRLFSFYLFLYLCALEMVPVLLLYKWFTTII